MNIKDAISKIKAGEGVDEVMSSLSEKGKKKSLKPPKADKAWKKIFWDKEKGRSRSEKK